MAGITEYHYTTLSEAVKGLNERGFTDEFKYEGQKLTALHKAKAYAASELVIVEHHRFEGTSAPQDMSVIYAIEATDGTKGTFTDAYGAYSDTDLVEFMKKVKIKE